MIKNIPRTSILFAVIVIFSASVANAQLGTSTGTTTLQVTVAAEAALTVGTPTTNLTSTGTNFGNYSGTTNLTYFVRTTQATGASNLVLQVTGDFSPAGGPSVGTPPTAGDKLAYSCTVANPGNNGTATACTAGTSSSTGAQTSISSFGADNRSSIGGNSATVNWTLTNDPKYKTGSYSATVTFTISAT
jgi:hypothetical protein